MLSFTSFRWFKKKIDFLICSSLEDNGLPRERTVYNVPKKKLHKMSMSSVLSTLLFGSHIFRRWKALDLQKVELKNNKFKSKTISDSIESLNKFKDLVAFTYWWPNIRIDGKKAAFPFLEKNASSIMENCYLRQKVL